MQAWFPEAIEPVEWNILFHVEAAGRWSSLIAMGRFKHVSAFAYLGGLKGWVLYDVQFGRTRLVVLPDNADSRRVLSQVIGNNVWIVMRRRDGRVPWFRFGFFCTVAIKHLIGLRSGALRPDALYRDCLAHGGVAVDGCPENSGTEARP